MDLYNIFILKKGNLKIELGHFKNFYPLDAFITKKCKEINIGVYKVSLNIVSELKNYIEPIYKIVSSVDGIKLEDYDDYGYPKELKLDEKEIKHNEFNPLYSNTFCCGCKLKQLYTLLDTFDNFLNEDIVLEFISSI